MDSRVQVLKLCSLPSRCISRELDHNAIVALESMAMWDPGVASSDSTHCAKMPGPRMTPKPLLLESPNKTVDCVPC